MRGKVSLVAALAIALPLTIVSPSSATTKAGGACKKLGTSVIEGSKIFTCIKSGKKLVWSKGITIPGATVGALPTQSQPSQSQPTQTQPAPTQSAAPKPPAIATLNKNKDEKLYKILREDADWIKTQPEYIEKKEQEFMGKISMKITNVGNIVRGLGRQIIIKDIPHVELLKKAEIEIEKVVNVALKAAELGEYYPIRGKTLSLINKDIQQNIKFL